MPDDELAQRLDWSEENFAKVLADLYREASSDRALHDRLMAEPYEVLNSRINVPEEYRDSILAKPRNQRTIILNVPEFGEAASDALPEGTSEEQPSPLYEVTCSFVPPPPW